MVGNKLLAPTMTAVKPMMAQDMTIYVPKKISNVATVQSGCLPNKLRPAELDKRANGFYLNCPNAVAFHCALLTRKWLSGFLF